MPNGDNQKNMIKVNCRNCGRFLCETDNKKICFPINDYHVCFWILKKYEPLDCECGQRVKIWKKEGK